MVCRCTRQLTTTMRTFVIALVALVAYAAAVPASTSPHADIYRNILEGPSSRIVQGEDAVRRQFPYQASLRWAYTGASSHICGGILISKRWVLTAGHCKAYSYGTYDIVLGQLQQGEDNEDIQKFEVVQFIVHPDYPGGVAANDIAVIELDRDAELTEAVQLATLAEEDDCNAINNTLLSGWGLTSSWNANLPVNLQWAELPRITNQQCADDLTSILGYPGPLDDSMICISTNAGKQQTSCNGDSGGPLVLSSNKTLVGVVSWGISPCGTSRAPSVFTRVCNHTEFINQHVTV